MFATVAKLRSFTQAAEELRIRQPSVSLLIKAVERELETKLFEKLGNKVHLTVAGEALLHDVEEILAKVGGIKERMDEIKGLKKGKLAVGGSALAGASFLPGAVQSFKKAYPAVEVVLTIQKSDRLEKRLAEGELDVAVLGRSPRLPQIAADAYRNEEIVVIAPPNHPLTKRRSVPLKLIARERLITQLSGRLVRQMVERRFAQKGVPFVAGLEVDAEFGPRDAIKAAVAHGWGLGFMSRCHVISDVKAGRLKVLKVPELNLKRPIYISFHKNHQSSSLIQAFTSFLKSYKERS